jgi:FAD/FMN-containing dehydrogenase
VVTTSPATADEAAALLAQCVAERRRVAICGGGTKSEWGSSPATPAVVLSTLSLNRVVAHRHGDLTATVEAGARLDDVNRELARHGQWLPLDPPWSDRATIGGIVATNDAGPRRHRYGSTDHQCDIQAVPAHRCISDRHHRSAVQRARRIANGGVEQQSPDADRR